jgi:hypothetical protein
LAPRLISPRLDRSAHGAAALNVSGSRRYSTMSDQERDPRTGGQWIRSVTAYLEFGAGSAWRRLSDPSQRNSPVRNWYLGGIRTINGIPARGRNGSETLQIVAKKPQRAPLPRGPDSPVAKLTAAKSRGWIVDELLRVDSALTDKKLLLRLSHIKLAGMLLDARSRQRRANSSARPAGKKEGRRKLPKRVVPPQRFPVPLRGAA